MTAQSIAPASARFFLAHRENKPWGHEVVFAEGEAGYVGKLITVLAGHSLSLQFHHEKDETISIVLRHRALRMRRARNELTATIMRTGSDRPCPGRRGAPHDRASPTSSSPRRPPPPRAGARTSYASRTATAARERTPPDPVAEPLHHPSPGHRHRGRPGSVCAVPDDATSSAPTLMQTLA